MVVVVAIIALIVGLSLPAASAGLDSVRMVSASDSVAAFLNAAVNRAERRQQPVELVVFVIDVLLPALKHSARDTFFGGKVTLPVQQNPSH